MSRKNIIAARRSSNKTLARALSARPIARPENKTDWKRLRALTEAEVQTAALADPDARPVRKTDLKRMRRTPQIKIIRRALGLT